MATGVQARVALAATTNTTIAAQPASGKAQVLTVSLTNIGATAGTFNLAVVAAGGTTPGAGDYIEYQQPLAGTTTFEKTGILIQNGQTLVAYSTVANVNAVVYGMEENVVAATGVFKFSPAATTWTSLTAGPASGRIQTVNLNVTNPTTASIFLRVAVSTTPTSPSAGDYIEYDAGIAAGATLERTGIVLNNTIGIGAYASAAGLHIQLAVVDDA